LSAPAQRELGLSPEAPNGKVKRKIHNDAFKNGATPEVIADAVDDRGRPKDLSWSFITPATTNAANELSQKLVGCRLRRQGHCTRTQHHTSRPPTEVKPHQRHMLQWAPGTPPSRRRLALKTVNPLLPEATLQPDAAPQEQRRRIGSD
jgi:hypothetical protein